MKKISLIIFIMVNAITVVAFDYHDDNSKIQIDLNQPIKFTTEGIQYFLKYIFNDAQYASKVLSVDFSHFMQFVKFGIDTKQGLDYLKQILRLFRQKAMTCEFLAGQEVTRVIEFLSKTLENFDIETRSNRDKQISSIKNLCFTEFSNNFDDFKKDPENFLSSLALKIHENTTSDSCEKETSALQVRTIVNKFIETCISKIIWSPVDGVQVWEEFKLVGDSIYKLSQAGIICAEEDLNDEVHLLLSRFTYFLSLAGSELPQEFFDKARSDLAAKALIWLNNEELETELTHKYEFLKKSLIQAQIRSQANKKYGIIS